MGYSPTIAECRAASVEKCQATRQSVAYDNAEGSGNIVDVIKYKVPADLTTPLTGGQIQGTKLVYTSFISPLVANYPTANVGDECIVLKIDSSVSTTAPYVAERWMFTGVNWEQFLTAGNATSGSTGLYPIYTGTSNKRLDIRANFTTAAGDNRAIYARAQYAGTTAQGESVRAYSQVMSTATSVHGIHATAEVATGGSIVGQAVAGRFTAATITGLTLAGTGSFYAVTAQTDNISSVLSIADSAHIRIEDLNTYGMKNIISLGTIVGRSTDKAALGPYSYVSGKMTFTAAGVSAAIRVKTPDGTFYIPMYLQGDVS